MKPIRVPIIGVTLLLFIYTLSPYMGFGYSVVFSLFLLLHISMIWMVVRILKDGEAPRITFEQQWYEDKLKS
ncbi:MAG: hypothetical protein OER04_11200 [Cyclobacteriaceae bacterium]|nr:hypothetical protein [Cyclobacteriaceae bacterium]